MAETEFVELSWLKPCSNQAATLGACVEQAFAFLARECLSGEVVIGDDGSSDGSHSIARALGARVIDVPSRGYAAAPFAATLASRRRDVIAGDSDASYDFSDSMRSACARQARAFLFGSASAHIEQTQEEATQNALET